MAKIHKSATINLDCGKPVVQRGHLLSERGADGVTVIESRTAAILAEARAEAACLVESARQEALQIRNKAWNEGYTQGQRAAEQEQATLEQQFRAAFDCQIDNIQARYDGAIEAMQVDLLELALQIAEKILGLEMSRNDAAFLALVTDALSRFKQGEKVSIKVSKNDYWRSLVSSSYAAAGQSDEFTLMVDEAMAEGSLLVESPGGIVDAGIAVQLGKIRAALVETSQEAGL